MRLRRDKSWQSSRPRAAARLPLAWPVSQGATLVEVLMSLLIMSIGVTSVFALFPIAILSSIKATQLTNAKILEENVVELLRTNPQMVECYPTWQPNTNYGTISGNSNAYDAPLSPAPNWRVVPRPAPGRVLSAGNMFFQAPASSTSGVIEPVWPTTAGNTVPDGTTSPFSWTAYRTQNYRIYPPDSSLASALQRSVYVVDPLGYWYSDDTSANSYLISNNSARSRFGTDGTNAYQNATSSSYALPRNHANLTLNLAQQYFSLGDTWTTLVELVPTDVSNDTGGSPPRPYVTFSSNVDISNLPAGARVTLVSSDGTVSESRYIDPSNSSASQVKLFAGNSFPATVDTLNEVSRARIEVYNRRYSFLLTVIRNTDGTARIYCPIFFNRSFSSLDERAFDATIAYGSPDTINVTLSGSPPPLISEGNFVCDVINGHWYKIVAVPTHTSSNATVIIDRPSEVAPPTSGNLNIGVMFHPGIIKVFDIDL